MTSLILLMVSAFSFAEDRYSYDGEIQFEVYGLEFRNFRAYPDDRRSPGYRANAKADAQRVCDELKAELDQNPLVSDYTCDGLRDIEPRRGYSTYQGSASFKVDVPAILTRTYPKIEGDRVRANDYSSHAHKWQKSRQVARDSYFAACEALETRLRDEFGGSFLVLDCGRTGEDGGDVGWHYFSTPKAYFAPDMNDIPECANGKKEDQIWWETEPRGAEVPVSCEFGGNRVDYYDEDTEFVCENQEISATGRERRGEFRGSEGSCNAPADCGDQPHGSRWMEIDHGNPIVVETRCEFGGNRRELYERERHYSCYNGDTRFNGAQRGSFIETRGHCRQPASCGAHDHGDRWWERTGRIRVPQYCPYGGDKVDVYEELTQFRCYDGSTSAQRTRRGNYIRTRGACNPPPRMMPPRMMPPRMMPPRMMPPRMMPPRMMPPRMMPPRMMPPRMMPPRMMPPRMMPPRMMPPRMMPPRMMPPRMMPPRMMPPRMMPPRMMPPRMMPPRMMPPRMMPPRMMPPRMMPPRMMPPRMMPPRMMPPRMMPPRMMPPRMMPPRMMPPRMMPPRMMPPRMMPPRMMPPRMMPPRP